jgi:esterase/lipase superfamily enzyme
MNRLREDVQMAIRGGKAEIKLVAAGVVAVAGMFGVNYSLQEPKSHEGSLAPERVIGDPVGGAAVGAANMPAILGENAYSTSLGGESSFPKPFLSSEDKSKATTARITDSEEASKFVKQIDSLGRVWTRVYFATDRSMLELNSVWIYARLWMPVAFGLMIAVGLGLYFIVRSRQVWSAVGTLVSLGAALYFTHSAVVGTGAIWQLSRSSDIAFGTNRSTHSGDYPLHLGFSDVTIPPDHRPGEFERPQLIRMEWKEDDLKHVVLQRVEVMPHDEFFADLQQADKKSALVFIHGFNVRFDDALRRTGQLAVDLEYTGIPILYSWPSQGKTISYTKDEANVGWTVPHLEQFLVDLRIKGNLKQIHVVAHSMGNRALLGMAERLGLRDTFQEPLIARAVMAAPDVDSLEFQNRFAKPLKRVAKATTVYGSRHDRALLLSESIHGYDRLGLVSEEFRSIENVDMVDTTPLDLSMLGHSYYGSHPVVLDDIKAFFRNQASASVRPWLRPDPKSGQANIVWRFAELESQLKSVH